MAGKGRQAVIDYANSVGGFDALQKQLSQESWINLTQHVGKNNVGQAQQYIKAAQDEIAAKAAQAATPPPAPTPPPPVAVDSGGGGGGGGPAPGETAGVPVEAPTFAAAPSMRALSSVRGGGAGSEGYGLEPQTPVDANLGQRHIPASSRALSALMQQRGRIY
jgi:hypothetical protein